MQRLLILTLALFTFLVAPSIPGLRSASAAPKFNFFGDDKKPDPKPVIMCPVGKKCVVTYRLSDGIDDSSSKKVIQWIDAAEEADADAFVLELNTPGGSVPDGFEISKRIENAKLPVTCVVDGKAASMGFYILQSCPTRLMTKRSTLMAHEPSLSGIFYGQPNQWEALTEMLKALRVAMAEHCNRRLTTSVKEYRARTDGGKMWWFTWQDGLKFHAVDKIVDDVASVVKNLS